VDNRSARGILLPDAHRRWQRRSERREPNAEIVMKTIRALILAVMAGALLTGTLPAEPQKKNLTCCEQAAQEGKECKRKCCLAAHREGRSCEKCNPNKEDLKYLKKRDDKKSGQ
jgi:hypothetical protein